MSKALFDVIRDIKGSPLTQRDVDAVNRALMGEVHQAAAGMKLSAEGRALITEFESYRGTTYPDPGPTGKPVTGGWGTTRDESGRPFKLGVTHPREYWERLKERDLAELELGTNMLIRGATTTQNQFDALVSFAYNVGLDVDDDDVAEGLGDSSLLKHHLAGRHDKAAEAFMSWVFAKGKKLKGLVRRRAAEAAMFERGS